MLPQGYPQISFGESIRLCMQGFCKCEGRARRSEFWWFYLLNCIITFVLSFFILFGGIIFFIIFIILDFVFYIPVISASTRRLHDINMSGFFNLLMLVPFGIFVLWYFWSIDSHRGSNIYGPSTKYPVGVIQTDPLIVNPQVPIVSVAPMGQPGYSPVQQIAYPGQQPIQVSPNVYPGQQPIPTSGNNYSVPQNIPTTNPNYQDQQNIPVAQPNYNNQQNIPLAQPNYNDQQNIPVAQPNYNDQQNIPVAQPNGYPQPQQNVPVAQPNNMVDKPSSKEGENNNLQYDPQYQPPMVPPPQNPPNY